MRPRSIEFPIGVLIFLLGPLPTNLMACSCGPTPPACALVDRAAVAFVGKVIFHNYDRDRGMDQRTLARVEVEESFRGLPAATREIWVDPLSNTSCGADMRVGNRMLIFGFPSGTFPALSAAVSILANPSQENPLPLDTRPSENAPIYVTSQCVGNLVLTAESENYAQADLEYLRAYKQGRTSPSVTGRVLFDDGDSAWPGLLSGARVHIEGNGLSLDQTTGASGSYLFPNLPDGNYQVSVSYPNYVPEQSPLTAELASSLCGYADFAMVGTGSISGTLLGKNGKPARGQAVELLRIVNGGKQRDFDGVVMTDKNGNFRFQSLPAGRFEVGVNLIIPPGKESPYYNVHWNSGSDSVIALTHSEAKQLTAFQLSSELRLLRVPAVIRWPNGNVAPNAMLDIEVGERSDGVVDANNRGSAELPLYEGVPYKLRAYLWMGEGSSQRVAHSEFVEFQPGTSPGLLEFTLDKFSRSLFHFDDDSPE